MNKIFKPTPEQLKEWAERQKRAEGRFDDLTEATIKVLRQVGEIRLKHQRGESLDEEEKKVLGTR